MDRLQVAKMTLTALHPHPLQAAFYGECNPAEDEALAADLRTRGQMSPIMVLPDGTILDGHRRAKALKSNGQTDVNVVVRHDLEHAYAATIESEFLRYNFQRRQLNPIEQARVALRLMEIERKRAPGTLGQGELASARDRVGKLLNKSGRNLERYFRVLETPLAVQNAVRDGRLSLVAGSKIASLDKQTREAIAKGIEPLRDTADIKKLIDKYVTVPDGRRHEKVVDAVATLARNLERSAIDLGDRLERVTPGMLARYLPVLQDAAKMLNQLLRVAKSAKPRSRHPAFAD